MLRAVRSLSTPSLGVRFLPWLVSWISIAGGLLAATCVSADTTQWLAQNQSPAGRDSVSSVPKVPSYVPAASAAVQAQKRSNYSFHLHGGLFAPIDVNATSPTLGLRISRMVYGHLQAGMLTGWTFRRKNLEQPVDGLPGLKRNLVLARLDGQMVPLMAFFQVNLNEKRFLVPYAGIATGYEWLSITGNDYRTGQQAKATYSNWAWESWGGFGMRLDPKLRVDGELFYNGGSLERDVTDASGASWREAIDANGVGARVGLDLLF